ncbi:MAG: glycosyltransferase family 2 protein, partial [Oscillospiraceae bacterium]|nr:glycosyltransferase family 2 protein [Oscillospiraceae bacterium]
MDKKVLQLPNGNYPLVSVIVPVYNVAPYLREALDSVIHQTYSHLEILIIDDGSTD